MKKYNIIYADPPWKFNFKNRKNLSELAKSNLYDTMSGDDICSLNVADISNDDAALFLWAMNSEIQTAMRVIDSWGFKYKTVAFTWVKTTKNTYHFGGGNWTRSNPELCLLATKGHPKRVSASVRNLQIHPVDRHSKKPEAIRKEIVKLMGDLPRIELFCRYPESGWDVWGNEVDSDIELKNPSGEGS